MGVGWCADTNLRETRTQPWAGGRVWKVTLRALIELHECGWRLHFSALSANHSSFTNSSALSSTLDRSHSSSLFPPVGARLPFVSLPPPCRTHAALERNR